MAWHEIVKYSPQNYNSDGVYTADEWTSRCDVGKLIFKILRYRFIITKFNISAKRKTQNSY